MAGPYFSIEGHDVAMYIDEESVEAHLEATDVDRSMDTIFRADGTVLRLKTSKGNPGKVIITEDVVASEPDRLADSLRTCLIEMRQQQSARSWVPRFARREGAGRPTLDQPTIETATLAELVEEFARSQPSH